MPPAGLSYYKTSAIRLEICFLIVISGILKKNKSKYLKLMKCEHIFGVTSPKKVVPSTNQFLIEFSIVKCLKYNIFHPRYKSTHKGDQIVLGTTFWDIAAPNFCSSFKGKMKNYRGQEMIKNATSGPQYLSEKKVQRVCKKVLMSQVLSMTASYNIIMKWSPNLQHVRAFDHN